jgi:acetylornithine deacetylase
MNTTQTLAELVAIDSVSSRPNKEIIDYLTTQCQQLGFETRYFSYHDENTVEKINLIALAGCEFSSNTQVELALVGHTDTVPYDPNWSEATNLTERDGKLYGRGACDTKGFIAAALNAVATIDLKKLRKPLALIFTADEEIGLRGAKYLADLKPLRVRYSIVGEPTSLQPIRAGKGYALAEVVVHGREAHSAYPALGVSAVTRAARLLMRIEEIAEQLKADQHASFDPPYTTINVGLINGGAAKNIIAGECKFTLEWRPVPTQPASRVIELVRSAVAEERSIDSDFDCEVIPYRSDSGFETSPESPLIKLLEEHAQKPAGTVAFGTEGAQMQVLGSESVVIGPGDIRVAHRTGEYVPIEELNRCTEILTNAVRALCN